MQTGDRRRRLRSISLLICPLVVHPWCRSDFRTPWKISNTLTFHLIVCKEVIELSISTMLLRRPKAIMLEQMRWKESATGDEISCRPLWRPRMLLQPCHYGRTLSFPQITAGYPPPLMADSVWQRTRIGFPFCPNRLLSEDLCRYIITQQRQNSPLSPLNKRSLVI